MITEPEDEDSEAVVEKAQLTTSALKKGLQMMDNSIISLRMSVSDKLGMRSEQIIIPYNEVCMDIQKKVKQSKIASFSTQSSVPPPPYTLHCLLTLTVLSQEN